MFKRIYRPVVRLNTSICRACNRGFKNEKSMKDHIFSRKVNDKQHNQLKNEIIKKRFENAKLTCPVCKQKFFRSIGNHFRNQDQYHNNFIKEQSKFLVKSYLRGVHCSDILKLNSKYTKSFSYKFIAANIIGQIGKSKFDKLSREILSKKSSNRWSKIDFNEKQKIMAKVREAEWSNLTLEQRRNHPWVIAGRKASLESAKKGSKNQKYAFELLKKQLPNFNWQYNYAINERWQFDMADPKKLIFIEWDGRHHFIPIHGQGYLNNRINKDKIKNKIITKELKGCLIRIKDEGRANPKFVEGKINEVSKILKGELPKETLIEI